MRASISYLRRPIVIVGAATILLLTGGGAIAVHGYNTETERICGEALAASREAANLQAGSVAKAAEARTVAAGVSSYRTDKSAALLAGIEDAQVPSSPNCVTRDEAAALTSATSAITGKAEALSIAADDLSADVTVFKAAETKRIAAEKKARDAKAAADATARKKAAAKAAAISEQAKAAAQPSPDPAYVVPAPAQVPAPAYQAPQAQPVPAPAPMPAAPAPAPAPGWTPPPKGGGHGSGGCTQIGDHIMCVGPS